jgi:hypothetical protein
VQGAKTEPLIAFGADTVTSFARTVRGKPARPEAADSEAAPSEDPSGYTPHDRQQLDDETERLLRDSEQEHGKTTI